MTSWWTLEASHYRTWADTLAHPVTPERTLVGESWPTNKPHAMTYHEAQEMTLPFQVQGFASVTRREGRTLASTLFSDSSCPSSPAGPTNHCFCVYFPFSCVTLCNFWENIILTISIPSDVWCTSVTAEEEILKADIPISLQFEKLSPGR